MTTTPKPRRDLDDWNTGEITLAHITGYGPSARAYAVDFKGTFLGYVVGRDGGWSAQPESDPATPVQPTHSFVFANTSRNGSIDDLLMEARQAGVVA